MRLRRVFIGVVVAAFPLAFIVAPPSQAQAADDLSKLAKMVPGVKKAKLKASVQYLAKKRHTSYGKELKAVIASINKQVAYNKKRRDIAGAMSVKGFTGQGGVTSARSAKWTGDIFVSTLGSQAGGINFGHTGLYYRPAVILHAPGAGKRAQLQESRIVQVGIGTVYMTTPLSISRQEAVANYAKALYEGQKYNYMYYTNKVRDGLTIRMPVTRGISVNLNPANRTNCSELVWGAYKRKGGIDLDGYTAGNGDVLAVFPWDIERSSLTTSYAG